MDKYTKSLYTHKHIWINIQYESDKDSFNSALSLSLSQALAPEKKELAIPGALGDRT